MTTWPEKRERARYGWPKVSVEELRNKRSTVNNFTNRCKFPPATDVAVQQHTLGDKRTNRLSFDVRHTWTEHQKQMSL